MKVALLADVHANLPALEAVLAQVQFHRVEAIWNLGDFLGYGAFPSEVVERLRAVGAVSIIGNYDRKVLAFERKKEKWRSTKAPKKFLAFRFAHEKLSDSARRYLQSLPESRTVRVGRTRVLLVHGSPAAGDEALSRRTPAARLEELAAASDAELIACGHSHQEFVRRAGGAWFVNPGSVGRPEGGDCRARYALIDFAAPPPHVELVQVEYDVSRAARAIREAGLPEEFAQMLESGQNLDQVQRARFFEGPRS